MDDHSARSTSCILQCGKLCDKASESISSIERWETIKQKALLWSGLDKFGNVYATVDWDNGPAGQCVHDSCRLTLCNSKKLEQAKKRHTQERLDEAQSQCSSISNVCSPNEVPAAKRLRSNLGVIHDKTKCVWCCKAESTKNPGTHLAIISYDYAWEAFKRHTVALEDQKMRDRINCLIDFAADNPYAIEIRYHHKCWLKYVRSYQKMSEDDKLPYMHDVTLREAQTIFFDHVRAVIFDEHELRSLQSLLRDYGCIISRYGFPTSGVKSSYIKDILTREFESKIGFYSRPQKNLSDLVYDTSGSCSYVEAALFSIGVSNEQLVQNVAERLRKNIDSIRVVPWPPKVEELEQEEELPPLVIKLLSALQGKKGLDLSPNTLALASLITQYVTKKPTTTAINATITLHGITRSKELVDSFYKLGMGISYPNVLFLRDIWTMHDLEQCSVCSEEIAEGKPSISIIDNDDFSNDTLTGGGTAHRCNWMFLQRLKHGNNHLNEIEVSLNDVPTRTQDAKLVSQLLSEKASEMQTVIPYKTIKRGEPPIRPEPTEISSSTNPQRKRSIIHALVRADRSGDRPVVTEQTIPSYNGFHASLNVGQEKSKAYFHMSYNQSPNKSVINDIMNKLTKIIAVKHMPFAFLVGDLPVYVLVTLLKAENSVKYHNIVPFLGPFHTQCSMMSAIYKRYKGSELEDVLVAAGVIADGSVDNALKGKHFKRGLRCLKLMYEALMSQLVKERLIPYLADEIKDYLEILRNSNLSQKSRADAHRALEEDADLERLVANIFTHVDASNMANYWKDFFSMVDALMQNVHAVHICNWDEYVSSLRAMLPWMIAYDNNKYGRWLPDFWAMLTTLPLVQVEFLRTDFTQSITGNPYSNLAWDMWIECTMNKGSKMKSGWLSILKNEKQLLVHCRNVNQVTRIRAAHNSLANRREFKLTHVECGLRRIREDEQCVQDLVICLCEFDAYPFNPSSPVLRTLQSAIPASDKLIADFNSAYAAGEEKLTTFLQDRVFSKKISLHDHVPLSKRLSFAKESSNEKPREDLKTRAAEMEHNALRAVINLVENSQLVNLSELLEHRVIDECVALFNCNGTYRKTQKSKLIQKLFIQPVSLQESYAALVDMGMVWRMATPSPEDRQTQDGTLYKWSDYFHKVTSIIFARHNNAHCIICVNDPYTEISTKDDERDLRVQGKVHIPNIYMKPSDPFPSATAFKTLLCSSSNKRRLQKLIGSYLTDFARNMNVDVIYSIGSHCTNLSSQQNMDQYSFDQSEADTILFSFYAVLRESGYTGPVVIDATDTDVYIAAAYISHQLPGMLCIKRKQETILCRSLVPEEMASCIVQLHYITGCDANSSFYGKGKSSVYDKVTRSDAAQQTLLKCGNSLDINEDILDELFKFTRNVIYGDNKSSSMAEARADKWKAMKKKSFLRLPPDVDCLRQHFIRANYLAYIVLHPSLKKHPSPIGHGWELVDDHCRPVRYTRPALPVHLPALGQETAETIEEEEHEETDEEPEEEGEENSELSEEEWSDSN